MLAQGDNGAAACMENFARLRASPQVLIGLWREQFRVSHFQGLRQHERLHVHELASVHQLSELAELDLNHRNDLVLGRNSTTLRDAIRAPVRREIKSRSVEMPGMVQTVATHSSERK
jgi:hypothetical protein